MSVRAERHGSVQCLTLSHGKANALDLEAVRALHAALEEAEAVEEIGALVITGRPGVFCVGLDNAVLAEGDEAARELQNAMGALLRALLVSRLPLVCCVTGHAVAAGAMLLLTSDVRIGAKGEFRIGYSEVGVGLPLPEFPVQLARQRLNRRWFEAATLLGRLFTPSEAVDVGFLDWVEGARKALPAALQAAEGLAQLDRRAYRETLQRVRAPLLD